MAKKLKINASIEADLDSMYFILGEPIQKNQDSKELNIMVSEESKRHTIMSYTTELETLKLIFQNMTLRSSGLINSSLNDTMEKSRVGVSQFVGSRFITCFVTMIKKTSSKHNLSFFSNVPLKFEKYFGFRLCDLQF